jgi:hypothetical protein
MNDPSINLVNAMYDQKIEDLRFQIRSEVAKHISSPTYDVFYKHINEIYIKQVEAINIERRNCINILSEHLYTQDFNSFMNIGNQMSQIKMYDKKKYDFLVDQAFAVNTPLSLFKFKYA